MPHPVSNVKHVCLDLLLEALGTAKTRYIACPVSGTVREIYVVADVATDDNNAVTTAIGGTAITGGAFALTTGNTVAGTVVRATPTALNTVRKGQSLSATTDGGGAAGQVRVTFLIEQE